MATHVSFRILLILSMCQIVGCSSQQQETVDSSESRPRVWMLPAEDPRDRGNDGDVEDREPAWPAAAVLVDTSPEWSGRDTLFLLSDCALDSGNAVASIPLATRCAVCCGGDLEDINVKWVKLVPDGPQCLCVVDHLGGSGGSRMRVFRRDCYRTKEGWKNDFSELLERTTCLLAYLADLDGNGTLEVLVAAGDSGDRANGDPRIYESFEMVDNELRLKRRHDAAEIEKLPNLIRVGPDWKYEYWLKRAAEE